MTREQFWALVAQSAREAEHVVGPRRGLLRRRLHRSPGQRHAVGLAVVLDPLPDDALVAFQEHVDLLRADLRTHDLWAAGGLLLPSWDQDAFMDLRTWLVSQGQAAHTRVRQDADALADVVPPDLAQRLADAELWGYEALALWESRTGQDMPRPGFAGEAGPLSGTPVPGDALAGRFPRLSARRGAG